jgi:hypothetical protein
MSALTTELKTRFSLASACLGVGDDAEMVREKLESALFHFRPAPSARAATLEQRFAVLAARWDEETAHLSSLSAAALHSAYQRIIGMGHAVVPLLLREMELRPNHWHWALNAITDEDPVPPEHYGQLDLVAKDWVLWGKEQGYRW